MKLIPERPALSEIQRHLLRVSCRRCGRIVEIQTADAVRLYGAETKWKTVGQRLLDNTCQQRTGRHEEDGCWPWFSRRRRAKLPTIRNKPTKAVSSHPML